MPLPVGPVTSRMPCCAPKSVADAVDQRRRRGRASSSVAQHASARSRSRSTTRSPNAVGTTETRTSTSRPPTRTAMPAVLRQAVLRDVEPGHDLHARRRASACERAAAATARRAGRRRCGSGRRARARTARCGCRWRRAFTASMRSAFTSRMTGASSPASSRSGARRSLEPAVVELERGDRARRGSRPRRRLGARGGVVGARDRVAQRRRRHDERARRRAVEEAQVVERRQRRRVGDRDRRAVPRRARAAGRGGGARTASAAARAARGAGSAGRRRRAEGRARARRSGVAPVRSRSLGRRLPRPRCRASRRRASLAQVGRQAGFARFGRARCASAICWSDAIDVRRQEDEQVRLHAPVVGPPEERAEHRDVARGTARARSLLAHACRRAARR